MGLQLVDNIKKNVKQWTKDHVIKNYVPKDFVFSYKNNYNFNAKEYANFHTSYEMFYRFVQDIPEISKKITIITDDVFGKALSAEGIKRMLNITLENSKRLSKNIKNNTANNLVEGKVYNASSLSERMIKNVVALECVLKRQVVLACLYKIVFETEATFEKYFNQHMMNNYMGSELLKMNKIGDNITLTNEIKIMIASEYLRFKPGFYVFANSGPKVSDTIKIALQKIEDKGITTDKKVAMMFDVCSDAAIKIITEDLQENVFDRAKTALRGNNVVNNVVNIGVKTQIVNAVLEQVRGKEQAGTSTRANVGGKRRAR